MTFHIMPSSETIRLKKMWELNQATAERRRLRTSLSKTFKNSSHLSSSDVLVPVLFVFLILVFN